MVALLHNLLLQILRVIDSHHLESGRLIHAKEQNTAAVLVGEAGQGVIEPPRTVHMGAFYLHSLTFRLLSANCFDQFQQL